ncbi:MAG: hypothetical protein PHF35_01185 [Candidatus Moranbacteria bacterium]|nr:hypothetical protein [Candidatus Moranbacteria bacterium]
MILASHILSGAVIGENINNPYIVAISAVAVHFLLDFVPHGDYLDKKSKFQEFWKVALDLLSGLGIVFAILYFQKADFTFHQIQNTAIGIFFSLLPDGLTLLYWKMGMKFLGPIYRFHQKLHLIHYPDFAPEREFRLKNNLGDVFVSFLSIFILIIF